MLKKKLLSWSILFILLACSFIPLVNSSGNEAEDFNSLGVSLTKNGSFNEALLNYDMALDVDPDYVKALDNKGSTLILMGEYDDAEDIYDDLLVSYPRSSVVHFKKAFILSSKGDHEAALVFYNNSLIFLI